MERRWEINSVHILLDASKKSFMKLVCSTVNSLPVMCETYGTKQDRVPHEGMGHKKSTTSQPDREKERDSIFNLVYVSYLDVSFINIDNSVIVHLFWIP